MDEDHEPSIQVLHESSRPRSGGGGGGVNRNIFRTFVSVALVFLILLHIYAYFFDHPFSESIDGDFSDVKLAVMQLSRGLTEVNRKHERLQQDLERISASLPSVVAAASRARDAIVPAAAATKGRLTGVEAHDFDRQVIDFALETAGARVIDTGDTEDHIIHESPVGWALHLFTAVMCRECMGARAILRPGTLPGECWAFKGSRGEVTVRLLGRVHISGLSVEHIPLHISPTREISSAPRRIQVLGLQYRNDPNPHDFGVFEYDKEGKSIQYFEVKKSSSKSYPMVKFKILSNWGNPSFTCIYRLRVHGELDEKHRPVLSDAAGDVQIE